MLSRSVILVKKSFGRAGKLGQQGGNFPDRGPERFFGEFKTVVVIIVLVAAEGRARPFVSLWFSKINYDKTVNTYRNFIG